jgi:hypothetical protein
MKVRCVGGLLTTMAAVLLLGGAPASALTVVSVAMPPTQPPAGAPGGNGACGLSERSVANPRPGATLPVHIYEPTGPDTAVQGGGRCDSSKRPTVFSSPTASASRIPRRTET